MVANGWVRHSVADIAAPVAGSLVGGPFGSNLVSADYVSDGIPVIRGQNMSLGRWVGGEFAYVSSEKAKELSRNTARPYDVVFTQRGTVGQVAIVPPKPYSKYVVSQSQMKLTVDDKKADLFYVYYFFSSPQQQEHVRRRAIQTGVPHTNLGILAATPIILPPLAEQRTIAAILGAFDDKIELNRRMNQTLEGIARALFKSWFVDFAPVRAKASGEVPPGLDNATAALFPDEFDEMEGYEVPRGWELKPLDEIATYQNGLAMQKYPPEGEGFLPIVKIRELRQGFTDDSSDKASPDIRPNCIIDNGDVVFSWSGSLLVDIWCGGKSALNQHLFKVTSEMYPHWFYYFWTRHHLEEFQRIAEYKATTMGHIRRHHLSEAMSVVAPHNVMQAAHKQISPLVARMVETKLQSQTLAALRDTLLPKLISGELRVEEAGHKADQTLYNG